MKIISQVVLVLLSALAFLVWAKVAQSPTNISNSPIAYFLDVGQGDAELIQKGNYQILIDGGPDDKVLTEIGKIMPLTDRKIEVMILSHPHADHLVGLNQILDRYEVGQIYMTGVLYTSNQYLEFLNKIKAKKIKADIPKIGQEINPFEGGEVTFLWPGENFKEKTADNLNNSSIANKFCYLQDCILFIGDLEKDAQEEMLAYYSLSAAEKLKANILKVPHHGSSNATSENLLKIAQPKDAVIEVGADNQFGHPHKQALDILETLKVKIYRTDRDGTINFSMN